jgi:hypothetical protein
MCLTQDDVKSAFPWHAVASICHVLDALNLTVTPPTVFQLFADRWNNKDINPVVPISECHEDCSNPIKCAHSKVTALMQSHTTESSACSGMDLVQPSSNHLKV